MRWRWVILAAAPMLLGGDPTAAGEADADRFGTALRVEVVDGWLSVEARAVVLRRLVDEIAQQSFLTVDSRPPLAEPISLELDRVPLGAALQQVLSGYNYALRRSTVGTDSSEIASRPGRLWIFGSRSDTDGAPQEIASDATSDRLGHLRQVLNRSDTQGRLRAVSELIDLDDDGAAETLTAAALTDDEDTVREEAVYGLGEREGPVTLEVLEQALADPSPRVREAAIEVVAELGGDASAWALAPTLDDPDPSLREEAVYALGRIASASTLPIIRRALADEKLAVREAAEEVLSELASEP